MKANSPAGKKYCLDLLERMVNIPSVFPEEEEIMLFLERELTTLGLHPKRIDVEEKRWNLLCTFGSGYPHICFNAHADTVPANMASVPCATIEGDTMYGLGTCDDKASIAAMVTAYLEIVARGDQQKGTVDLLISVDEEGDGKGVKAAIAQGYRCDYAIVGEPTNLDIVHAHNGLLFYTLITEGVAAHGSYPQLGINSVDRMMELVSELRDNISQLPSHPATGPASLNLGEIHAGDRPNRVPEKCTARIDIRFPPPATNDQVFEATKEIIKSHEWAQYIVEKRGEILDTPLDSPLIKALRESGRSLGASCKMAGFRGWTEAEPFHTLLGIDSLVFGPGSMQQAHSSNEFTSISQAQLAAQIHADLAQRLGDELAED